MMIPIMACILGVICPTVIATLAAWEDARSLHISNKHSLVLLIVFPVAVLGVPYIHLLSGSFAALAVLLPGLLLFALRWVGAGDIKLATVMALYLGWDRLDDFLLGVALMGGLLAVIALFVRRYRPVLPCDHDPRHWLDRLRQGGRDIPYGIALAVPFVWLLTERFMNAYDFLSQQSTG